MTERPILFMDSMVTAILSDRKTVTRRVGPTWAKVQPGDRLWVREAHTILDGCCWPDLPHRSAVALVDPADDDGPTWTVWSFYRASFDRNLPGRWRPSIHMPRWACRILLDVVSVTVQYQRPLFNPTTGRIQLRLPDLDSSEALREGFANREDFMVAWTKMHDAHVGPVYRVEFRRVP